MPLNPTLPADGALIIAAELRAQFAAALTEINSLKARVTALEQGGGGGGITQQDLDNAIAGTARNPAGQMGNLDPNWNPNDPMSADDGRWLRDRMVELNNATAR